MKWFFIIMIMQLKMTIDNALVTIQTNQKGDFVRHNQLMEAGLGMEWRKRQRKRQEKETREGESDRSTNSNTSSAEHLETDIKYVHNEHKTRG